MFIEMCDTKGVYQMIDISTIKSVWDAPNDNLQVIVNFKDGKSERYQCEYSVVRQILAPRTTL